MFSLLVRFEVLPDQLSAFDELAATTLQHIQTHEPDTLVYLTHQREGQANERVFYECYRDRAAFEAHEQSAYIQHFLSERSRYLAAAPEVWWLTVSGGRLDGHLLP